MVARHTGKQAGKQRTRRAASATRPDALADFHQTQPQRHHAGQASEISKPLLAASNNALTMVAKISVCPSRTACASAAAGRRINADQMTLSNLHVEYLLWDEQETACPP